MIERQLTLLIVDDEPAELQSLCVGLELAAYQIHTATDGIYAQDEIKRTMPDLMLLDIQMPRLDGLGVLQWLREFSDLPVVILTARREDEEKVNGLNLGADDYVTKPVSIKELDARIKAVLRRAILPPREPVAQILPSYHTGELYIDTFKQKIYMAAREVHLAPVEYKLLLELARHIDKAQPHDELLLKVWGPRYEDRDAVQLLRATIYRLRKKLEPNPSKPIYIINVPCVGYQLKQHPPTGRFSGNTKEK
jgi:DNA-binding response OmpR family regulator